MNPWKVVIQHLIWAVYSGVVGDEVGTSRRRTAVLSVYSNSNLNLSNRVFQYYGNHYL